MSTEQSSQQAEATSNAWRPEPGEVLEGKVTEISRGWSDFSESFYPILVVGGHRIHCFHRVLRDEVMRQRPKVGEHVKITYLGPSSRARAGQSPAHLYTLSIQERPSSGEAVYEFLAEQQTKDDIPF